MTCPCGKWMFHSGPCVSSPLEFIDLFAACAPPLPYDVLEFAKAMFTATLNKPVTPFDLLRPRDN